MDIAITFLLEFCRDLIVVGGAVIVVIIIMILTHTLRIVRDVEEMVDKCKDTIIRLCSIGGGTFHHIKQAIAIAQTVGGALSTLQRKKRSAKK